MADREMLFDLMMRDPCPSHVICDPHCKYYKSHHCHAERYADHLIANGVTIQRWIPVTELPPRKGCYLVTVRHWCDGKPVTREAYYTCSGWISCERGQDITERVMYWMPLPLPEPPKGE